MNHYTLCALSHADPPGCLTGARAYTLVNYYARAQVGVESYGASGSGSAAAIHSFDSRAGAGVVCCAGCHRSMPELRAGSKWLGCRKSLPIPQPCQTGNSDQPATALGGPLMVTRLRITCPPSLGGTHHGPYCDHPPLLTLSLRAEEAPLAGLAALSPTAIRVVRRSLRMRTRYHCVLHTV